MEKRQVVTVRTASLDKYLTPAMIQNFRNEGPSGGYLIELIDAMGKDGLVLSQPELVQAIYKIRQGGQNEK
jgi:hypothetical protein